MSDADNPFTFEGARRAQLRDAVLNTTPEERVRWLEEALRLAEQSGALARTREKERAYWERLWQSGSGS